MSDNHSLLPYEARQIINERIRSAADARTARSAQTPGRRRHRLVEQLCSVAERLDA